MPAHKQAEAGVKEPGPWSRGWAPSLRVLVTCPEGAGAGSWDGDQEEWESPRTHGPRPHLWGSSLLPPGKLKGSFVLLASFAPGFPSETIIDSQEV